MAYFGFQIRFFKVCRGHTYPVSIKDASAAAKSFQSCPTLWDPIDGSPPGSPIPGILQARTLKWVAISFSNAWKWKVKVKSLSCVRLVAAPWTAAYQAPPSMGFSRQEDWSGVPLPSPPLRMSSQQFRLAELSRDRTMPRAGPIRHSSPGPLNIWNERHRDQKSLVAEACWWP